MTSITVEFVLPGKGEESASINGAQAEAASAPVKTFKLRKCSCGSEEFVLANDMKADSAKGIPASRMFECVSCGRYHLG